MDTTNLYKQCTLTNIGLTCYMNAALQLLFSMDDIVSLIMNLPKIKGSDDYIISQNNIIDSLKALFRLMKNDDHKDNCVIDNTKMTLYYNHFKTLLNTGIGMYEDAQEFLSTLIDKISDNRRTIGMKLPISDVFKDIRILFSIREFTILTCNNDTIAINHESIINPNTILSLGLEGTSIQTCINDYYKEKAYTDTTLVARCGKIVPKFQQIRPNINEYNKYLIIQLNRFKYNNTKKVTIFRIDKIESNKTITITNYKETYSKIVDNEFIEIITYKLIGCILYLNNNSKDSNNGHYVYMKNIDTIPIVLNDSQVEYDFTYDIDNQGYIFLYERIENREESNSESNSESNLESKSEKHIKYANDFTKKCDLRNKTTSPVLTLKKPTPPPTAQKPISPQKLKAIFDYVGQQNDELSFKTDDILMCHEKYTDPKGWISCFDKISRTTKIVPKNYTNYDEIHKNAKGGYYKSFNKSTNQKNKNYKKCTNKKCKNKKTIKIKNTT